MRNILQKAELMDQEYMSHWHPNLTVNLVIDQTNWMYGQVPQPLDECKFIFTRQIIYWNKQIMRYNSCSLLSAERVICSKFLYL